MTRIGTVDINRRMKKDTIKVWKSLLSKYISILRNYQVFNEYNILQLEIVKTGLDKTNDFISKNLGAGDKVVIEEQKNLVNESYKLLKENRSKERISEIRILLESKIDLL